MRLLVCVVGALAVLLSPAPGSAKCGADPSDLAAVAATAAVVADACPCCSPTAAAHPARCARRVARSAVAAGALPQRCIARVVRAAHHACPLASSVACRLCSSDAQCNAAQFCSPPPGKCAATGICVARPKVCPDVLIPVCGCDGNTYTNDCVRERAGVGKAHEGACAGQCAANSDCDDGNPCTADACRGGVCEHGCICAGPDGAASCCPGPAAVCVKPCGSVAGVCGGSCPTGATCETLASAASCACVSGPGGPCGGNVFAPPPVCAPGLVCRQSNPDATGTCEKPACIPYFQDGCSTTGDCCEPCGNGRIAPCAVCLGGQCVGAP